MHQLDEMKMASVIEDLEERVRSLETKNAELELRLLALEAPKPLPQRNPLSLQPITYGPTKCSICGEHGNHFCWDRDINWETSWMGPAQGAT